MNPKAARDAIAYAREANTRGHGGDEAAQSILDAMAEVLTYATKIELRLGQHLNGGSVDHTDLLPIRDQRA